MSKERSLRWKKWKRSAASGLAGKEGNKSKKSFDEAELCCWGLVMQSTPNLSEIWGRSITILLWVLDCAVKSVFSMLLRLTQEANKEHNLHLQTISEAGTGLSIKPSVSGLNYCQHINWPSDDPVRNNLYFVCLGFRFFFPTRVLPAASINISDMCLFGFTCTLLSHQHSA